MGLTCHDYMESSLNYLSVNKTISKEMLIKIIHENTYNLTKRYPLYVEKDNNLEPLTEFDFERTKDIKIISTRNYTLKDKFKVPYFLSFSIKVGENIKKFRHIKKILEDNPYFNPTYLILTEYNELIFIYNFSEIAYLKTKKELREYAGKISGLATYLKWKLFFQESIKQSNNKLDGTSLKYINFSKSSKIFVLNKTFKNVQMFANDIYEGLLPRKNNGEIIVNTNKKLDKIINYLLTEKMVFLKNDRVFNGNERTPYTNMSLNVIKKLENQLAFSNEYEKYFKSFLVLINNYKQANISTSIILDRINRIREFMTERVSNDTTISYTLRTNILRELNIKINYDLLIYSDAQTFTKNYIVENTIYKFNGNIRWHVDQKTHLEIHRGRKKKYESFFESWHAIELCLAIYKYGITYERITKKLIRRLIKEKGLNITDKTLNVYFRKIQSFFKHTKNKDFFSIFVCNLEAKGSKTTINRFNKMYKTAIKKQGRCFDIIDSKKTIFSLKNKYAKSQYYFWSLVIHNNAETFFRSAKTYPTKMENGTFKYTTDKIEYIFNKDKMLIEVNLL